MKRGLRSRAVVMLLLFCSLLAVAAPSSGQGGALHASEAVVVQDKAMLEGIWRFPPFRRGWNWKYWYDWGPEMYCRVGRAGSNLTFDCLGLLSPIGEATIDEDGVVHLRRNRCWIDRCSGYGDWVFRGKLESKTVITGHIGSVSPKNALLFGGEIYEQPERITITKVVLTDKTTDVGGQAQFLRQLLGEMANGQVTEPYARQHLVSSNPDITPVPEEAQLRLLKFQTSESLRPLGQIQSVIYVGGYAPLVGWNSEHSFYSNEQSSIYDVEFENGELLCALHRRPDGVLNQFRCI